MPFGWMADSADASDLQGTQAAGGFLAKLVQGIPSTVTRTGHVLMMALTMA